MPGTPVKSSKMIGTLTAVAVVCGLLIVTVFQLTLPIITQKRAEQLRRAVFHVVQGATTLRSFVLSDEERLIEIAAQPIGGRRLHVGYDDTGKLKGVAIEAQGQGFQDLIRIIYGYDPDQQRIVGLKVLESKETPGLGDKIEKDPMFQQNFTALDVTLDIPGTALQNPLRTVKSGEKTKDWEISAITGATISSKAIARILQQSTGSLLPTLYKKVDRLREEPQ